MGRFGEAILTLQSALTDARQRQVALFEEPALLIHLGRAHLGDGDGAPARRWADEAVAVAHRQGARVLETLALLTRSRVRRATAGPGDDVDADLAAALDLARETGASAYEQEIDAENRP